MDSSVLFSSLQHQLDKQLPFVAYRKPNTGTIQALLQNSDELFYPDDFNESGFVLAPFDDNNKTVLMPLLECEILILKDLVIPTERGDEESHETIGHLERSRKVKVSGKSKENHINLVKKGVDAIKSGQFNKVVLSRMETVEQLETNPINIFKRLLQSYPTAFVYCWFHPKVGLWLGATPETLLGIKGDKFTTMSLAGTQVYNGTLDVVWGEKEKEEQQFVTDFIVDNLKPVIGEKNIRISDVQTVKAGKLLHLQTMVKGVLSFSTFNFKNLLTALHPTPAVCGLPKDVAKDFILKNEGYNREFYTGFLGELNINDSSNLFVNLRCMQLQNNSALIYVGGGITKDSNPEAEWQETVNKSKTIKSVLS